MMLTNKNLIIRGSKKLQGSIRASGAKNTTTKLLVASLLSDKLSIFHNVPTIGDVAITVNLCREIGASLNWNIEKQIIEIQTKELRTSRIPQRFSGANRIPILLIGALLGRTRQEIIVPTVGGDSLGKRPVNFHIDALRQLGAFVEYRTIKNEAAYFAHAPHGLIGTQIVLPFPSVGATENILLAAAHAKGVTIIKNAAIEPEVIDLILFLQKFGVSISIDKTREIRIEETTSFYEVQHEILPDRNEVVSYALATVSTKGRVFIEGAQHIHLISFLNKLRQVGGNFSIQKNGIEFFYSSPLRGNLFIETDVHPGFMTDWQQPFAVLLTQAEGISIIHETVYENRFGYTDTLREMGADLQLFSNCFGEKRCRYALHSHFHSLVIKGPTPLYAKKIYIPDLRAGFAYVMAALLASDRTEIHNFHYLERGYENIVEKLSSLGADISLQDISNKECPVSQPLSSNAFLHTWQGSDSQNFQSLF